MAEIISHIYQDKTGHWVIQSNENHSAGVAKLASQFAGEFGMSEWGKVLGLLHEKRLIPFSNTLKRKADMTPTLRFVANIITPTLEVY